MVGRPQTIHSAKHAILCVDDEPQLLEALALTIGHKYYVELAAGGRAALEKLREHPRLSVIVSDMRMPEMDGVQFLSKARDIAPDARRILLTGYADADSAIAAVNEGRIFKYLTKPCPSADLLSAIAEAVADYEADLGERSAIRRSIARQMIAVDRLTGLASREALLEQLCLNQDRPADLAVSALFLIEIAHDQATIDESDSKVTESVLRVLSDRLKTGFATAECIARCGPNSLAVILAPEASSDPALELLGLKLVAALEQPVEMDGIARKIGLHIGVAPIPSGTTNPEMLMRYAELAAREAARAGGNSVHVFSPESRAKAEYRRELGRALRTSLAREELVLHYQPIVDLERHCLHSVEALARWEHPKLGFVSPATFIPLIEQMNLMSSFGDWALARACSEIRPLLGATCPRVSVNVSLTQLLDVHFMHDVYVALEKTGLDAHSLELEVTESVCAENFDTARQILTDLRNLGVGIAIDDFGSGYSSLHYLTRLPVSVVKIDGSFVRDFDHGGAAVIEAALSIAAKLQIDAIVEGIETDSMLSQVRRLGATKMQGYLFARPMPESALSTWLADFTAANPAGDPTPLAGSKVGP
jgi:diguanylate cyclase (GGDEF)-like protein